MQPVLLAITVVRPALLEATKVGVLQGVIEVEVLLAVTKVEALLAVTKVGVRQGVTEAIVGVLQGVTEVAVAVLQGVTEVKVGVLQGVTEVGAAVLRVVPKVGVQGIAADQEAEEVQGLVVRRLLQWADAGNALHLDQVQAQTQTVMYHGRSQSARWEVMTMMMLTKMKDLMKLIKRKERLC